MVVALLAVSVALPLIWMPLVWPEAWRWVPAGWLHGASLRVDALLTLGLAAFAAWCAVDIPRASLRALVLGLTALLLASGVAVCGMTGWPLGWGAPLVGLLVAGGAGWGAAATEAGRRPARVRERLQGRLAPEAVLRVVNEGPVEDAAALERVVVLDFAVAGGADAPAARRDLLRRAVSHVLAGGGYVERLDGGGLRAVFGAWGGGDADRQALECAWAWPRPEDDGTAGGALAVSAGAGHRMTVEEAGAPRYSVVSEAADRSLRAVTAAMVYGSGPVITAELTGAAAGGFVIRKLCDMPGEAGSSAVFELSGRREADAPPPAWLAVWEEALAAFAAGDWKRAAREFRAVEKLRNDPVAALFAARAEAAAEGRS